MTPRELIASEIARQYPASADGPTLADRILTRLRYAGFAVVPRVATPEMVEASAALPVVRRINQTLAFVAGRQGTDTGLPAPPNSAVEQIWGAMISAAEQP